MLTTTRFNENDTDLFLASFLFLFLELACIRWLPSEVLSLAYFSNVVLIACFLGLGLGCLLATRRDLLPFFPFALLIGCALFLSFRWFEVALPPGASEWLWSHYDGNRLGSGGVRLGIVPTVCVVFVLTAALFVPLGQKIGALMETMSPLRGYSLNVGGSIAGILGLTALSFARGWLNSPPVWFLISGMTALYLLRRSRWWVVGGAVAILLCCTLVGIGSAGVTWSPYYSLQTRGEPGGPFDVFVNKFFHQRAVDLSADAWAMAKYGLTYDLKVPDSLLILGSGTGNDVAVANSHTVGSIDAVEIDPVIAEMGDNHPQKPYQDPDVDLIVTDARTYLLQTDHRYDMVLFGTLDAHALLSGKATVRLDNFVYTQESMEAVGRVLSEDGVVVVLFSVPKKWIHDRLLTMIENAFPDSPVLVYRGDGYLFNFMLVAGPGVDEEMCARATGELGFGVLKPGSARTQVPTDDWPYLYLSSRTVPAYYLKAIAVLIAVCALAVWLVAGRQVPRVGMNFFALGVAFLLLETKSVTTLSLLFGSTWLVNTFVFSAVLTMVLCANLLVSRITIPRVEYVYIFLALSLLANYLVPAGWFLSQPFLIRSVSSALFVSLPIFAASVLFAYYFRNVSTASAGLGLNVLGSVVGGFLEYSSMVIGLNGLYLLAGGFYLLSYVLRPRRG